MIPRRIEPVVREFASYYPVVAVTGPRQSGKTTLCQATFPDKPYVSLEALDLRAFAEEDPRGFLRDYRNGAILDEVQQAPGLLSFLQEEVDRDPTPGRFILTGSQHFALSDGIAQSLAGRVGLAMLLPPDFGELQCFPDAPTDLFDVLWQGAYPRIHDQGIPPQRWLADYTATYLQRDVRQVLNVGDLRTFSGFLKLCAGRSAQEVNLSKIGADAGLSHNTVRSWLSVLETSFVIQQVPAWHTTVRRQVIKRPKLHFLDTGLLCYLLGIRDPDQLRLHPLRGAIFETWVTSEAAKLQLHRGHEPGLSHYRESRGPEIDLLVALFDRTLAIEVKSGATPAGEWLDRLAETIESLRPQNPIHPFVVFGGESGQTRSNGTLVSWRDLGALFGGSEE